MTDQPLAILAHGFPDSPATWRHLAPRLQAAGFRVATPWAPGLGPAARSAPPRLDVEALADALLRLHHDLGGDRRAVLVGHDWGAVAGQVALCRPTSPFRAAVLLAVPPMTAMRGVGPGSTAKILIKGWYAAALQLPFSSALLRPRLRRFVSLLWRRWSPGYTVQTVDLDGALEGLRGHGLGNQIRYYRQLTTRILAGWPWRAATPYTTPTLFLHGESDGCIDVAMGRAAAAAPPAGTSVRIVPGVGHFLHLEDPGQVGDLILAHLQDPGPRGRP